MTLKTGKKLLSVTLALVLMMTVMIFAIPQTASAASGTVYYVDSVSGNDTFSGTSSSSPWQSLTKVNGITFQPGDKILLKRGSAWNGYLYPKGSGVQGNPITISAYGEGNLPLINGNGLQYTGSGYPFVSEQCIDAPMYLRAQNYWTIEYIEVTNYSATVGDRAGIHLDALEAGSYKGITIRNTKVHDISSNGNAGDHGRLAAIEVWGRFYLNPFSDIVIENNEIYTTGSTAIFIHAMREIGTATGNVVRGNYMHDIGGDGILVADCIDPLIEYNTLNGAAKRCNSACAGIWPFKCINALFQYNEAYGVATTADGQGFDADYNCVGTTFQYNYAHDNRGGFFLLCSGGKYDNDGVLVRYNIGQNNAGNVWCISPQLTNAKIYNNVTYNENMSSTTMVFCWPTDLAAKPDNIYLWNNIFYNNSEKGGEYNMGASAATIQWDSNLFFGRRPGTEPADPNKIVADPKFYNAGGAGVGMNTCDAYKITEGSPAYKSGKVIPNNGGIDFFGNPVSATEAPNRGAYNGDLVTQTTATTTTTTVDNGYAKVFDWENQPVGTKNTAIYNANGDTTTWLSDAKIADQGLSPNSTKSVSVTNIKTSAGNCKLSLDVGAYLLQYLYKMDLLSSNGIRIWLAAPGGNITARIHFKMPDGSKYYATKTATPSGGWVYINWTDTIYKDGPDKWGDMKVTPEIMLKSACRRHGLCG